jgi:hypothetical protein
MLQPGRCIQRRREQAERRDRVTTVKPAMITALAELKKTFVVPEDS